MLFLTEKVFKVTILFIGILLAQPLYANAEGIKAEYFQNNDKNTVVELVQEGKRYYLVQATFSGGNLDSTVEYRKSKLSLLTRFTLVKFLQRKYKGVSKFQLSGLQTLEVISKGGTYYQLSQISTANITPLSSKGGANNLMDAAAVENSIVKEVSELELKVKTNPTSIDTWKNLYNLYFITGELDKANSAMDKVISLEFAH